MHNAHAFCIKINLPVFLKVPDPELIRLVSWPWGFFADIFFKIDQISMKNFKNKKLFIYYEPKLVMCVYFFMLTYAAK